MRQTGLARSRRSTSYYLGCFGCRFFPGFHSSGTPKIQDKRAYPFSACREIAETLPHTPETGALAAMDDEAAGVPEWVVTYGDMMSLLLTFFIMLVSLSEVAGNEKYRAVLNSLQNYVGYRNTPLAPPGKSFPLNSMIAKLATLGSFLDNEEGRGGVKREAPEGAHIRVLRKREGSPFQVGESIRFAPHDETLSEKAMPQLVAIAKQLAGKPNKIDIRAHASSDGSAFKENIELSYRRARNVRAFLLSQEIAPNRMRATTITDSKPLPGSAGEGSSQFDRVEVLILDLVVEQ